MTEAIYEADTLVIDLDVVFPAGGPVPDLTGATVVAIARRQGGGLPDVSGAATVSGATTIQAVFAPGSLPTGVWDVQIRATKAGQVRTLLQEAFSVRSSF